MWVVAEPKEFIRLLTYEIWKVQLDMNYSYFFYAFAQNRGQLIWDLFLFSLPIRSFDQRLVDKLTRYVIPVLNPDDSEYSFFFCLIRSFDYTSGGQVDLVCDSCFEPGWLRIFSHDKPNVEKDAQPTKLLLQRRWSQQKLGCAFRHDRWLGCITIWLTNTYEDTWSWVEASTLKRSP